MRTRLYKATCGSAQGPSSAAVVSSKLYISNFRAFNLTRISLRYSPTPICCRQQLRINDEFRVCPIKSLLSRLTRNFGLKSVNRREMLSRDVEQRLIVTMKLSKSDLFCV